MPRPVSTNSKCPRYWYFRERYLAKKRGVNFSGKGLGLNPATVVPIDSKTEDTERIDLMCKLAERISALGKLRARA